ncbi:hypothetical protein KY345_00055 [Candidatus Woesearchaeota archaeon]|nr:hypothetical protein [Candidatus Woesearchaeota archaeon]
MEAKKVKAEVVGVESKWKKRFRKFWSRVKKVLNKIKLFIAVLLDLIDLLIGWIPVVNTVWDVVCFLVLLIILKNKKLAFLSLVELPLIGLPPFSIIDMFLPICTIVVLLDNQEGGIRIYHR